MIEGTGNNTFTTTRSRRRGNNTLCDLSNSNIKVIMITIMELLIPLIVMNLLFTSSNNNNISGPLSWAEAVRVQRLSVPDLVVIDQLNNQQPHPAQPHDRRSAFELQQQQSRTQSISLNASNQPEAASLINSQDLSGQGGELQSQITFECLISFDKRKDKNLIVKWHYDDRIEPIYQWIPELNKRSIAPQYRANIAPIVTTGSALGALGDSLGLNQSAGGNSSSSSSANTNQIQLLEASFRLVRPSKELGGKYTCSAISTQNDDSKWKKMIVYTPPRTFRFNASRIDIGAQLASQRERLIQLSQPAQLGAPPAAMIGSSYSSSGASNQLPLAYRMRGFESQLSLPTTISPQMYSTIDYVNVNQQRVRQQSSPSQVSSSSWLVGSLAPSPPPAPTSSPHAIMSPVNLESAQRAAVAAAGQLPTGSSSAIGRQQFMQGKQNGVKLVCDIDQVFPVPEVSIYRLAKLDGSHPDKLAKLDTRIERNSTTGLFHVQVISIIEDDELQMKYGQNEPVYFECLIALTNLELSKYADNKRSIVYRPGLLSSSSSSQGIQTSEDIILEQAGSGAASSSVRNKSLSLSFLALILVVYVSTRAAARLSNIVVLLR